MGLPARRKTDADRPRWIPGPLRADVERGGRQRVAVHDARVPALSDCLDVGCCVLLSTRDRLSAEAVAGPHPEFPPPVGVCGRGHGAGCRRDHRLPGLAVVCRPRGDCCRKRCERSDRRPRCHVLRGRLVRGLHRRADVSSLSHRARDRAHPIAGATRVSNRAPTRSGRARPAASRGGVAEPAAAGDVDPDLESRSSGNLPGSAAGR